MVEQIKGEYWVAIVGPVELPKSIGGLDMPLRRAVVTAVVDTFGDAYQKCVFDIGWVVTEATVERIKQAMYSQYDNRPTVLHIDEQNPKHNAVGMDGFFCKYCGEQVAYGTFVEEEKCSYKNDKSRGIGCSHDNLPHKMPPMPIPDKPGWC